MKFLFVANTPRDPLAGASGCDISVMEVLRGQGHEIDEVWCDAMPHRIRHPNLHQWLELPGNFARVVADRCKTRSYDVIQVNQPHAWLAAKQHRVTRRPGVFVNRSHGWEPALRRAVARFGSLSGDDRSLARRCFSRLLAIFLEQHNKWVVRWSDALVLCSPDDREYIEQHYADRTANLLVLTPGIDPCFLGPTVGYGNDRLRRILYIGNFCSPKAPEVVAGVFREVCSRNPQAEGTWICPARFHSEVRQLLGASVGERVQCLDWMPKDQLCHQFDRHSIFLFPSHFEGFGLSFLQAIARGLCILGTRVGGLRDGIEPNFNGFLFERGDISGISQKALWLLENPVALERLGRNARKSAESYTWEQTAQRFERFCQTLLDQRTQS